MTAPLFNGNPALPTRNGLYGLGLPEPTAGAINLILLINARTVPRGVAQKTLVDGINSLEFANLIAPKKRVALADWLHKLTDVDASLRDEVNQLQARLR